MKILSWLALGVAGVLLGASAGHAGPAAVSIKPHRAIYKMSLTSAKNGSTIRSVTGQIEYEWADSCDAWATQQHMSLRFTNIDGEQREIVSHVLSTESKDGKQYQFNIRRFVDGSVDDAFKGEASLSSAGGKAVYDVPREWGAKSLPKGSLFPSAHTILIIQKAMAGERLFTRPVFDGSDEAGIADVSAFIGAAGDDKAAQVAPDLMPNALLAGQAWPVRLAFFAPKEGTGEPDYEMDLVLQPNGIARAMHIDYGDFIVGGTLEKIEALDVPSCAGGM